MPLSDAATIALARTLYPAVTTAAASDAFLTAWLPWARQLTGLRWWGLHYDRGVAMLIAARAYIADPAGLLGGGGAPGPVRQIATLQMSAMFDSSAGSTDPSSLAALLATTQPGRDWLATRDTLPGRRLPHVSVSS